LGNLERSALDQDFTITLEAQMETEVCGQELIGIFLLKRKISGTLTFYGPIWFFLQQLSRPTSTKNVNGVRKLRKNSLSVCL
jgi:hypothetical protein